jgi:predicted phosphoribosyltransferase
MSTPARPAKILIVDDLLATGETALAAARLIKRAGARSSARASSSIFPTSAAALLAKAGMEASACSPSKGIESGRRLNGA